jgi:RimJ/RimL family protein N-acetyltransferase
MVDASTPVSVPHLRTARLLLREFRQGDFDAYATNLADPVAARYTGGPIDRRTAWRIFAAGTGNWMLQGIGWWAVEHGGAFAGVVGLFYRDGFADLEIGWTVLRPFWRQGLASEATAEALRYARDTRGTGHVIAFIAPENEPSMGVARRIGMRYEAEVPFYDRRAGRWSTGSPS